ncbi:MAG: redox-sensitive transcriptional activator SoxR [Pseudomonadota bacterium]|jgi:MerR family redox-sensitive transcriptional activator SoxR|nr:redox-sensitive transcriptional activator SoxR [Pseudomonadota bacterium]
MAMKRGLSIGDLAGRTGLSVSAIRFYERKGLITPDRNAGNQRRYEGSDIRRLSFILIAQQIGLTIEQIREVMAGLPDGRTPTKADWSKISRTFRKTLNNRIAMMERMRDKLDGCIGCGCLSLKACTLYNPDDKARRLGVGPRYVVSDER